MVQPAARGIAPNPSSSQGVKVKFKARSISWLNSLEEPPHRNLLCARPPLVVRPHEVARSLAVRAQQGWLQFPRASKSRRKAPRGPQFVVHPLGKGARDRLFNMRPFVAERRHTG